jgi:hypothetical protein
VPALGGFVIAAIASFLGVGAAGLEGEGTAGLADGGCRRLDGVGGGQVVGRIAKAGRGPLNASSVQYATTAPLSIGCNFAYSRVPGNSGGTGNFNTEPVLSSSVPQTSPKLCPTIDAGTTTKETVLDNRGWARPAVKGGKVDVGCYEVK